MKKTFKNKIKSSQMVYRYASLLKEQLHRHFVDERSYIKKKSLKDLARQCSDKLLVRDYVRDKGFGDILNQVYGVFSSTDEIDLDKLPDRFVLKANHGSGWNSFCRDKNKYDWKKEKYKMDTWMMLDYSWKNFEWVYRDMEPRIICEKFLDDGRNSLPTDYKIFCFDGVPEFTYVCVDRDTQVKYDYYDVDWVKHPIAKGCINSTRETPKPLSYDYMLEISRVLSAPFPAARIDLYEIDGKVVFGEITFLPSSGFDKFDPDIQDYIIGEKFILPDILQ